MTIPGAMNACHPYTPVAHRTGARRSVVQGETYRFTQRDGASYIGYWNGKVDKRGDLTIFIADEDRVSNQPHHVYHLNIVNVEDVSVEELQAFPRRVLAMLLKINPHPSSVSKLNAIYLSKDQQILNITNDPALRAKINQSYKDSLALMG